MGNFRTPLISSQREDGSTFYTFSSAIEDIGLNINERNNKVRLSHYVVLDIPEICFNNSEQYNDGVYNLNNLFSDYYGKDRGSKYEEFKTIIKNDKREWFKIGLQNYMMNMETTLRNQGTYDFSTSGSITERCFWKFMQKSGAFNPSVQTENKLYFHEKWDKDQDSSINPADNTLIKGFGNIEASSQSSNQYNINNETYVLIPSSYGQMKYLMKPVEDNNYIMYSNYEITSEDGLLEGHKSSENPGDTSICLLPLVDDGENYSYKIGNADSSDPETEANKQMLQMVFDTDILKTELAPDSDSPSISYDELAINPDYILNNKYKFNAILLYYSIYDSVGNTIATNLFGLLILNDLVQFDGDEYNGHYKFDELVKYKSNNGKVGGSYFFRVNMKTASIYDSTNSDIIDYSSGEAGVIQDFSDVISNLKQTVNILTGNAVVFKNLHDEVTNVKNSAADAILKIENMQKSVNDLMYGNVRDLSTDNISAKHIETDELIAKNILTDNIKEITYTELKETAENGKLIPGMQYRIMDYETTTTQEDTTSAGNPFDIIVIADTNFTLNENARAAKSKRDVTNYFEKSNLASWRLKYTLFNDTSVYSWADSENGKGVIYYMEDENGNICHYDFKNIMFARYEILERAYLPLRHIPFVCTKNNTYVPHKEDGEIKYFYTFSSLNDEEIQDLSTHKNCESASISEYWTNDGTRSLNNIVAISSNGIKNFNINSNCCDITVSSPLTGLIQQLININIESESHDIVAICTYDLKIGYNNFNFLISIDNSVRPLKDNNYNITIENNCHGFTFLSCDNIRMLSSTFTDKLFILPYKNLSMEYIGLNSLNRIQHKNIFD